MTVTFAEPHELRDYHYPKQYEYLLENVAEHELEILHEEGLYRHLRFKAPGTWIWHFDLVTWPGCLYVGGDIGEGYVFTRERDMLTFFDHGQPDGHINPSYWAEKLTLGARSVREFSQESYARWLEESGRPLEDSEATTREEAIAELELASVEFDYDDLNAWDDYRFHFILALHAILWGAKKYHAQKSALQGAAREG